MRGGVLVLAATPIGDPARRAAAAGRRAAPAPTWSPPRTPAGCAGWPPTSASTSTGRVVSYYEGNEAGAHPRAGRGAARGRSGCCWSPTPGCRRSPTPATGWSAAAVEAGVPVTAVPGPSAVLTALAVSGLPVDRFCFEGFLPRKAGERARRARRRWPTEPRTMVFFEAPHRLAATLAAMAEAFGRRPAGPPSAAS